MRQSEFLVAALVLLAGCTRGPDLTSEPGPFAGCTSEDRAMGGLELRVRVLPPEGSPASPGCVSASNLTAHVEHQASLDAAGVARLTLPAGLWRVAATLRDPHDHYCAFFNSTTIEVRAAREVVLQMPSQGRMCT